MPRTIPVTLEYALRHPECTTIPLEELARDAADKLEDYAKQLEEAAKFLQENQNIGLDIAATLKEYQDREPRLVGAINRLCDTIDSFLRKGAKLDKTPTLFEAMSEARKETQNERLTIPSGRYPLAEVPQGRSETARGQAAGGHAERAAGSRGGATG